MKRIVFALLLIHSILPTAVFALECKPDGLTVIYVNGILTNKEDAQNNTDLLRTQYEQKTHQTNVKFLNGYNESHIAGGGDIAQSAAQIVGKSFLEFDRDTILMQIHPQVSTQKILLLGHSQGTFYTNAIYQYLTNHGVPEESVGVYNLATPADRVEGGGAYLTSTNDRFINAIRQIMILSEKQPLPANINIPIPANESNDVFGGHHFQSDYLGGAPNKIVSDMESALRGLKTGPSFTGEGCFNAPPKTLSYKAKGVAFAVLDTTAEAVKTADVATVNMIDKAAVTSGRALGTGIIITGKAVVFAADATAKAIIAAAEKASAAASAAAAQLRNIFASASSASGNVSAASQLAAASLVLTTQPKTTATPTPAPTPAPVKTASIPSTEVIAKALDHPPVQPKIQPQIPTPPVFGPALISVAPGFGGGGAPVPVQSAPAVAPITPLTVQTPLEGALFATSSVTFTGTTISGYTVVASYESTAIATTADAGGNWAMVLTLPEGATSVGVVATDSAGNTSDAVTRTITVDTISLDAPSASVAECTASMSASFCLIASTGAALSWTFVPDTAYYAYAVNDVIVATTTGAVATLSLTASASSTISVAAYDAAGNAATSTPVNVYVLTQPAMINEVAWAGTPADAHDQWIEVRNISPYALLLSNVAFSAADGSLYIQLAGTLPAGGYYLLERREEATGVTGDLISAFSELSQTGMELHLLWGSGSATTTLDSTPAVSACAGWCPGIGDPALEPLFFLSPMSMERTASGTNGADSASWQFGADTGTPEALDASGNTIQGTPRAENSTGGIWPPLPPIPPGAML